MIGHLANKEALIDALFTLYNSSKYQKSEYIQRFIELCKFHHTFIKITH